MANPKKIAYWLISLISVIAVYGLYTFAVKEPTIKPPSVQKGVDELPLPDFPQNASKVADVGISSVAKTEFVTRDKVTFRITQIFGFEEMLNPKRKNERWKLKKPYMKLFDKDSYCEINSDMGDIRVETVMGDPTPTQGTLSGDVTIKFESRKNGKTTQTFVYLDTLDYDSDRSELATDGKVELVSEDVVMEGQGMLLLYNTALDRIEYFEIRDLDHIHIYNVEGFQGGSSDRAVTTIEGKKPETLAAVSDKAGSGEKNNYYQCSFRKNVMINHSDRLVATGADNINIFNIIHAKSSKPDKPESPAAPVAAEASEAAAETAANEPVFVPITPDKDPEVIVTCEGGFVITPLKQAADEASRDKSSSVLKLQKKAAKEKSERRGQPSAVAVESASTNNKQKPARFHSRIIDFYMDTNTTVGYGLVEFIFHPVPDRNAVKSNSSSPIVITANDKVRYVADEKIAGFSGNVVCSRTDITDEYVQESNCMGEALDITLYNKPGEADKLAVKHVTVSGEETELISSRSVDGKIINQIQLLRSQIDYDATNEIVKAGAGGEIAINNANAPPVAKDKGKKKKKKKRSLSLSGPCYASISGFDVLEWSLMNNTVFASGEKDNGVEIGYIPVVDGKLGRTIHATAKEIAGMFTSTDTKRTELVALTANNGIHYKETDGHEFYGDRLFYNGAETLMTITGQPGKPCFVNGGKTDRIDYNLATGRVKTSLSSRPSIFSSPGRRR